MFGWYSTLRRWALCRACDVFSAKLQVPTIQASEIPQNALDFVLVDVREAHERAVSTLPRAITGEEWEALEPKDSNVTVVAYCTAGIRSAEFAAKLRAAGVDCRNLRGGVLGWAADGREFVTPDGEATKSIHVYDEEWRHVPAGYEAVW